MCHLKIVYVLLCVHNFQVCISELLLLFQFQKIPLSIFLFVNQILMNYKNVSQNYFYIFTQRIVTIFIFLMLGINTSTCKLRKFWFAKLE